MVNAQSIPFQLKILYEKYTIHKTKITDKNLLTNENQSLGTINLW